MTPDEKNVTITIVGQKKGKWSNFGIKWNAQVVGDRYGKFLLHKTCKETKHSTVYPYTLTHIPTGRYMFRAKAKKHLKRILVELLEFNVPDTPAYLDQWPDDVREWSKLERIVLKKRGIGC